MLPQNRLWTRREAYQFLAVLCGNAALFGGRVAAASNSLTNDAYRPNYGVQGYAEPAPRRSINGRLATTVRVQRARNQIGSDVVELRSYNGELVGPTLRLKPGDVLELRLENYLPWIDGAIHGGQAHRDFNATNLHTHGLHVSPQSPSDNVLITILPKDAPVHAAGPLNLIGAYDYKYQIPSKHLPGTHWYHSHLHGSTAIQLASGMSGALIIEGDIDQVPEIRDAFERVFVFQQIPYSDNGSGLNVVEDTELDRLVDRFNGDLEDEPGNRRRFTTLNGGVPILRLRPGAVERWRLIHGGIFEALSIDVVGCDRPFDPSASRIQDFCGNAENAGPSDGLVFYPIARDGITLGSIDEFRGDPLPRLGPGNRMDVLVKAVRPGTYILRKRGQDGPAALNALVRALTKVKAGRSLKDAADAVRDDPYALAIIVVTGEQQDMRLPSSVAMKSLSRPRDFTSDQLASVVSQEVNFFVKLVQGRRQGQVDGYSFDPDRFPRTLRLGDVEKWRITGRGSEPHPFHIHVNPFLLLEDENGPVKPPLWLDTCMISGPPPESARTITILTRCEDFVGKFVLHCHNLIHEDEGMMQVVEVLPRTKGVLQGLQYYKAADAPIVSQPFYDRSGAAVRLKDFVGRVVLLTLWDTSCTGGRGELQALNILDRRAAGNDFSVIAVAQGETVASVETFYTSNNIAHLAIYVDQQKVLLEALRRPGEHLELPRTVIVDRSGHVRAWLDRSAAWDSPAFDDLLKYFRTA